ncbi:hypothetical protein I580_02047 [Enterococcus caccae ATCC BAA-1240]|uniref:Uncharacterized protein n=1 Tax=Enterococcus caccae ATCC BAA-1240 TaxID=1158612 RepID=R3TWI2_9ENTE|nr:hypothetical protein UC7_01746 [Enterococcus caccae ATCC BAA-1240]EOT61145.1 hypothetical protein I580_02047 [Enterococcus caccae ATCC BAA-1240]
MKIKSPFYLILSVILLILAIWDIYSIFSLENTLSKNIIDILTALLTFIVSIVCFSKATGIE